MQKKNYTQKELASTGIMDCRTKTSLKLRTKWEFSQYDDILTKEQPVVTQMMIPFEAKSMQIQYNLWGYNIDLYFNEYKFSKEIDENGQNVRNTNYKLKELKAIEQELSLKSIRIDIGKSYPSNI